MARRIVNIINFVRGCEPRDPELDLFGTTVKEAELCDRYNWPCTFLLQYDAMIREDFSSFFQKKAKDPRYEIGFWLEVVRPLAEKVGIAWRGNPDWQWDWHTDPDMSFAYTPKERERIIDEAFAKFRELFGFYPRSVGSWMMDTYSCLYMQKRYDVRAFCICREQFAIDAYTLWGGYYNGPYYASDKNLLSPAQKKKNRIEAPVFRMLGPDPLYNYSDAAFLELGGERGCPTIEPVWRGGFDPDSIDSFFEIYFKNPVLSNSYIQLGQENSFGWADISKGLPLQFEKLKAYMEKEPEADIRIMTLVQAAELFRKEFPDTPPSALCALRDWRGNDRQSFWHDCRRYRANLVKNGKKVYFRDIRVFDDGYPNPYLDTACRERETTFDCLPVVDGHVWRDGEHPVPGLYLSDAEEKLTAYEADGKTLVLEAKGLSVRFEETRIVIRTDGTASLEKRDDVDPVSADGQKLLYSHNGYSYAVKANSVPAKDASGRILLRPEDGEIVLSFD